MRLLTRINPRVMKSRPYLVGLVVGLLVGVILAFLSWHNWFSLLDQGLADILYRTGTESISERVVIVTVDDHSLETLGRWADWPRQYYAQLLERLREAGARTVGFDISFAEPSADDQLLVDAIRKAKNVVLPVMGADCLQNARSSGSIASCRQLLKPHPSLSELPISLGHVNAYPSPAGTIRWFPALIAEADGSEAVPAFALTIVAEYLRLPDTDLAPQNGQINLANRHIPVDRAGRILINYAGLPFQVSGSPTFKIIPFAHIINGEFEPSDVQGKIVLVGVTASGLVDTYLTPVSGTEMSGVEIWANAIEMILTQRFLREQPFIWQALIIMCISIAGGGLFFCVRPLKGLGLFIISLVAYWVLVVTLFDRGLVLDLFYPTSALLLTYGAGTLYQNAAETKRRTQIANIFGQYVPSDVANMILKSLDEGELAIEGTHREATVLFADIRNFVGLIEGLPPDQAMGLLSTYLEMIVDITQSHGGTIISFLGDGVLAAWNIPLPCPNHARRAVEAALDMRQGIANMDNKRQGTRPIKLGTGINSGPLAAGAIGNKARKKYTVIGNTVNVASRLCEIAEGEEILIGQRTYELVEPHFDIEALWPVTLRHSSISTNMYAVNGRK